MWTLYLILRRGRLSNQTIGWKKHMVNDWKEMEMIEMIEPPWRFQLETLDFL